MKKIKMLLSAGTAAAAVAALPPTAIVDGDAMAFDGQ